MKKKKFISQFFRRSFFDELLLHTKTKSKILPIGTLELPQQEFCLHLNVSQCSITESSSRFVATIYNPRSHQVTSYVRLPVMNGVYTVLDPDGITHTFV